MSGAEAQRPLRLAIFSRYSLADQFDLVAELPRALEILVAKHSVMHLSFRGVKPRPPLPPELIVSEMPIRVDRGSQGDILFKSLMLFPLLPLAIYRLRRFKPDVIFNTEVLPLYGLLLKLFCGSRVVVTCGDRHLHNLLGRRKWTKPLLAIAEYLERLEISKADGIFTRGQTILKRIGGASVPAEYVRIVRDVPHPDCFSPQDQSALRARCGFAPDDVVLHYHGVMHKGKGLDMLLRWTAELHRENPKIGIIMVGSGHEEAALRALAVELGMGSRAYFSGWLPTVKEVGDYCNASDICVPMRAGTEDNMDMIPGALIHSLACGKIVVAPRMPGMAEMIRDGENGFLFTPDDGDSFKSVIRNLIARRSEWPAIRDATLKDVEAKYTLAAAARQYAEAVVFFATCPPRPRAVN